MTGEYLQHTSNEAREKLDEYLRGLKPMPEGRVNTTWAEHRKGYIKEDGEYAIGALIPEEINVTSGTITNTINHLGRNKIKTIHDLAQVDLDRLNERRGIGPEFLEFTKLLQDAAKEKIKNMRSGYLAE